MYLCNGGTKERATKRYIHKLFSRILGDTYCRAEKRINKSERKCLANFYVEENAKDDCEPFHTFCVLAKPVCRREHGDLYSELAFTIDSRRNGFKGLRVS